MNIVVSVPGKVHVMGEHAVVYGKPALLAAVDMRLRVTLSEGMGNGMDIRVPEGADFVGQITDIVCNHFRVKSLPSFVLTIDSDIPPGYHLGSSAAVAVAVVGALTYTIKRIWNPMVINQLAYEAEKIKHGNPSGGDNTIVTSGGIVWFRKELEFLKSMWQLPVRFPDEFNHFFLIDTGRPKETTFDMVAFVRNQYAKNPSDYEAAFNENERQCKRIANAMKEKDESEFIDALKKGEQTLEHIGVVSPSVVPCIRAVEETGGAAKILGGGGRTEGVGFLLSYCRDEVALRRMSQKYGYSVRPVVLGGDGVRLEKKEI